MSKNKYTTTPTLFRLFSLVKPHTVTFALAMVALTLGSGVNLAFPEIIRRVLNHDSLGAMSMHPTILACELILLFAFQGFCFYFRTYYFGLVGLYVVTDLRRRLFSSLVEREIELFDAVRSADLVSRLMNDTSLMQDAVSVKLSVLIRYSLQVMVGLGLMVYMSPRLTASIVISLAVLIGLSVVLGRRLRLFSKALQAETGNAASVADDALSGIRIVKAYAQEHLMQSLFDRANESVRAAGLRRASLSAFFQSFVNFLMNGALVIVLLYGIFLASNEVMSFGDLTSFLLYGAIVAVSFAFAVSSYGELIQAIGGAERVFEFLDASARTERGTVVLPLNMPGRIEFKDVSFSYPSRADIQVLDGVTFMIPAGKTTAIVGASGSGKSTIASLLLKFYSPTAGAITLDGTELEKIDPISLRKAVALVPQDARLFGMSIRENLLFGNEKASAAEVESACKSAAVLELIRSLPDEFETRLGQHGASLSGGERQRIAIARALLRKPSVLILDESTAALDSENERRIQESLKTIMAGKTTVVIAHRLSSIRNAEHVIVLDSGCVVQEGSFEELLSRPGFFQDFVRVQERRTAA